MDFWKFKEQADRHYLTCFARTPICFERGEGSLLYDTAGHEYIDFVAGIAVNVLGHNHPLLVKALTEQAQKLIHISNLYYSIPQAELCARLVEDGRFDRVFLCNSGAEANEAAFKLVRKHWLKKGLPHKKTIVSALGSFHGRTLATVTAGGQPKYSAPFAPLPAGFVHTPYGDLTALREALTEDVGALILETIQGESGVIAAKDDFLVGAYALCRERNVLFMLDEIQTGVGRTGKFFSFEHYGIRPDLVTLAKGLAGGVPIGALLARGDVAVAFEPGDHGTTFGGNPLACAAALAVLDVVKNQTMLDEITKKGAYLGARLAGFCKYKFVKTVRGRGLLWGLELAESLRNVEVVGKMANKGILINAAGNNTLRFAPPLIITYEQIDTMVERLTSIFASTNI